MVCRGLLLMLHRAGEIELPPVRQTPAESAGANVQPPAPVLIDTTPISRSAKSAPAHRRLQQVRRTAEEPLFNSLIEQHHYLGYEQPVGEHLKYLVWAPGAAARVPGVEFSAAAPGQPRPLHRLERGGAPAQHPLHGLQHALSDPAVGRGAAPGLAHSGAHGAAAVAGLGTDLRSSDLLCWKPSWIRSGFAGTCYRAANWVLLGQTTGRGKDDQTHRPNRSIKEVLGYPLTPRFRELLQEA